MKTPLTCLAVGTSLWLTGCTGEVGSGAAAGGGPATAGGTSVAGGSVAGGGEGVGGSAADCTGDPVVAPRRLVRLTLRQLTNAIGSLLGPTLAAEIAQKAEVADLSARAFPPLAAQQEGTFVTEGIWAKAEEMGRTAAQYVRENYATVTGCALAEASEECAQQFIAAFAQRAFRRPVEMAELVSLQQVFTEAKAAGFAVPEALETTIWAILTSPHFIYRSELGDPAQAMAAAGSVSLTAYELASDLAFFLTDAPPDPALLEAAAAGKLATEAGISAEVDRLLAIPEVKQNLQQAVFAYFGISNLDSVVIDSTVVPEFDDGMRNSMYRETQEFLDVTLWGGKPIGELLTSRRTVVNSTLAKLYGVELPAGESTAVDHFVPVELPPVRAGLLTQAGFLTARARPDIDSVVGRALMLSATMLCAQNPTDPPEALKDAIDAASLSLANATERQKADYRMSTSPCNACHLHFDAYGLVLENYDLIGRYRTSDPQGRPIDPSVTLPPALGGLPIKDAVEMGQKMADSGIFAACMSRNLMKYALAEGNVNVDDCAVQEVTRRFLATPRTFSDLVRQIAVSKTIGSRLFGG